MHVFSDDDIDYACWVANNPNGFVLNVRRNPNAKYTVLHRAACHLITRPREVGVYTGRGYRKVAETNLDELRGYTRSLGRVDGSFSNACGRCGPLNR